jgi:predicted DNA-binding transcriptional regulator
VQNPPPLKETDDLSDTRLTGTTYKVYHYMLKQNTPVGISEVQRGMGLSSPSVAQYHIRKLVRLGLIREEQSGYVVDRVVMENVVRIRRVSIPIQTAYVAFFGVTLLILLVFIRPPAMTSDYFFAIVINIVALGISLYEASKTQKRL